ncbi:unnamed protein product [Allacma fusca]|uniref:Septin-type G domain-containing protein n=1 Tax=Allacma fusca TaxID=39272 RepID=A0A8J2PSS1_9HEXA|nr:unnamed protein product [Allacma fusca]
MYGYSSPFYSRTYGKPSNLSTDRDRPSTLNLGSTSGGGINSGSSSSVTANPSGNLSSSNMPNKPSRYTPVLPSLPSASASKSSSYTSLPAASAYSSTYGQRAQEVITVPPKSTLTLGQQHQIHEHPSSSSLVGQYYPQHPSSVNLRISQQPQHQVHLQQPQHQYTSGVLDRPLSTSNTSKSTHNLIMDSIPDVFCLSCPPAEFKFSDAYRAKTLPRTGKENERLIGFATLPEQVHRKTVKKGFDFTLMAIGDSGLGKSTLINSLFMADFYQNRKTPNVNELMKRTTSIQKHTTEIEERGVKLRLTVVDTPGFGDAINNQESWKACVEYIEEQFQLYFLAESGLNRQHIQDSRIHCCLYFVPPCGHGLRPLDIDVLRNLQNRVNIIPIIAKADTLTPGEVKKMKEQVLDDLRKNQIQIYQFPDCDEDEDEEFKRQDIELKASIPFAVASSETFVDIGGRKVRGRQYPWGVVEVENPSHSDFAKLRTMLIQSHMHDLKETTQDLHYENFRAKAIAQISNGTSRERPKLKRDSSADSPLDILQQKEAEIKRMQQMISKMEAKLQEAGQPKSIRDSIIDL